jgi:hypothetical protein
MQAHQADLGVMIDEDAEGHGIIDGDHPDQNLAPSVDVESDWPVST